MSDRRRIGGHTTLGRRLRLVGASVAVLLCVVQFGTGSAMAGGAPHMRIKGNSTASDEAVAAIVEVDADPKTVCSGSVRKGHYSLNLPRETVGRSGAVYWQWQINRHVTAGRWTATVICRGSGWHQTEYTEFPAVAGLGRGSAKELFVPHSFRAGSKVASPGGEGEGGGGGGEDLYPRDQCTWWVAKLRPDLPWFPGESGNALNWTKSAQKAGFAVGGTPKVGAVAVFQRGQYNAGRFGHVAYVLAVNGDTITISEDNFRSRKPDTRTIPWSGLSFIGKRLPSPIKLEAPGNITPPQVSGSTKVGKTLICTTGSWSGNPMPTYTYQWLRDDTAILGATESTYSVQVADEGHAVSCEVTATNSVGSKAATSIGGTVPSLPVKTGAPEISGSAKVGETLICSSGSWSGSPISSYNYQWLRGGTAITDATENTYKVQAADEGHIVSCEVTAVNAAGSTAAISAGRNVPSLPVNIAAPEISGTPKVGELLMCRPDTWTGSPAPVYSYQWVSDGTAIQGATVSIYTVQPADEGQSLSCAVTATNTAGSNTATSGSVSVPSLPVNKVVPKVSGTPKIGEKLDCSSGSWSGSPISSYSYQWLRNGIAISQATGNTYEVRPADEAQVLSCEVTVTNAAGSGTATSIGTSVPSLPVNTVPPKLSGMPKAGATLECSTGTWTASPTPTYSYQWLRDGKALVGAIDDTYEVRAADEGHTLSCEVIAADTAGSDAATSSGSVVPEEVREREEKEKAVITSVDNTKGDLAPYEGEFTIADQQFTAQSDRITYAGVTIADPNLPVGPSTDTVTLELCDAPKCTGVVLASEAALVNNYGLTSVEFKEEVAVTEGHTYYLVWAPPPDDHGSPWLTFWHGGASYVAGSQDMEAVVRGYNHAEGSGYPLKGEIASYLGTQAPPAPYVGSFIYAYQNFEAASNRITKLGVVVGNRKQARGAVGPEKIKISLCATPKCAGGALASAEPYIVNYGITEARIPAFAVIPGETYFVNWESPDEFEGEPWVTFWLGKGPLPEEADAMQAFAKGYDEGSLTYDPSYFMERPEEAGKIETFKNYEDVGEAGPDIGSGETVEVTCKVFAPAVEWSEPEGYWYRIHSSPWNDEYYAAANEFQNTTGGDGAIPSDPNVPNC